MTVGEIVNRPPGSVRKTQRDRHRINRLRPRRRRKRAYACIHDRMPSEKSQQVHKMAAFTDDTASTHARVLDPVRCRYSTRVDGHDKTLRPAHAVQQRVDAPDMRGKSPIESHHDLRALPGRSACLPGSGNRVDFLSRQRQRLLHVDVLAGL